MVTAITLKCDWKGCMATITVECRHDAAEEKNWRQESYGLFSLHLCPEHRRHNWLKVREQTEQVAAPSTAQRMNAASG